jgi:hypothetical protein
MFDNHVLLTFTPITIQRFHLQQENPQSGTHFAPTRRDTDSSSNHYFVARVSSAALSRIKRARP